MGEPTTNIVNTYRTGSTQLAASTSRDINTFEVIDYDAFDDNYAVIYKKVHIVHTQVLTGTSTAIPYTGHVTYGQPGAGNSDEMACPLTYEGTDILNSDAIRTVLYKLWYKIKDYTKEQLTYKRGSINLATCTITANNANQSVEGQRIYGTSIQVTDQFICYSYELNSVAISGILDLPNREMYDGPLSLEDWNYDTLKNSIWQRDKQIVGLININDGVGSVVGYNYSKEYDILDKQQYSVGVVEE
jgi:hypothetical protein